MADKRKLQGDIERCLKKVSEGVESFEDTWKKIYNTTSSNQKEKYEADLKKEIKKLQRLRDQIKTWLTSNDVKDKSILQDNRKLIETQMERFKVVERETKIKAYSKEGLGAAQKVDPAQKEKDKIGNWLTDSIDSLTIQLDQYESEIEMLRAVTKKKKNQEEKGKRIEKLESWLSKHRYHIFQLEALLRMLDNGTVEVSQIKRVQDDVNHYVESSQESDFQENEYIYDDLDLEDFDEFIAKQRAGCNSECDGKVADDKECNATSLASSSTPTSVSSNSPLRNSVSSIQMKEPENKTLKKSVAVTSSTNSSSITSISVCDKPVSSSRSSNSSTETSSSSIVPEVPIIVSDSSASELIITSSSGKSNALHIPRMPENCWFAGNEKSEKINGIHSSSSSENISSHANNTCSSSNTLPHQLQHCGSPANQVALVTDHEHHPTENSQCLPLEVSNISSRSEQACGITEPQRISVDTEASLISPPSSTNINIEFPELVSSTALVNCEPRSTKFNAGSSTSLFNFFHPTPASNSRLESQFQSSLPSAPVDRGGRGPSFPGAVPFLGRNLIDPVVPPIIGRYPVGSATTVQESCRNLRMLETSSRHLKYLPDCSNRVRSPIINYRYDVPHYYKSNLPQCDSFEFYQHLSAETLFFIFYYMAGSKAQYLAAKTLKKQSWRFHTRLMLWFQRHEEPKRITEEYEQGTYIYFDFEKWSQRKKDGFTFEYRYLEDIDLE